MQFKHIMIFMLTLVYAGSLQAGWFDKAKDLLEESGVSTPGTASSLTDGEVHRALKKHCVSVQTWL